MSSVIFLVDHSAGKISKAAGELATYAKSIGESVAVIFADNADQIASQLNVFSVDKVITVAGEWDKYGAPAIAEGLAQIVAAKKSCRSINYLNCNWQRDCSKSFCNYWQWNYYRCSKC